MKVQRIPVVAMVLVAGLAVPPLAAQSAVKPEAASAVAAGVVVPSDYVIGPDDQIGIVFWKDRDLSVDAVVRPDGKISLPLGNEIVAAGLTPEQLKEAVIAEAGRFVESPTVNIIVRQINSRKVYITGQVEKAGAYSLTGPTTVMQLIALAGGLREFAKAKEIVVMRADPKGTVAYPVNYEELVKGRHLEQNIALRPGDTVVIP